jgi:ABC-type glycerol-3-phosphate transport system substrate-binding protein
MKFNRPKELALMNTKQIAGLSVLVLAVSACSTTTAPPSDSNTITTLNKTERYQVAVQSQARFNGVEVVWVNPPDEGDLAKYELPESSPNANGSN